MHTFNWQEGTSMKVRLKDSDLFTNSTSIYQQSNLRQSKYNSENTFVRKTEGGAGYLSTLQNLLNYHTSVELTQAGRNQYTADFH